MVFSIVHKSKLVVYGLSEQEEYPSLAGYVVLIRDMSIERHTNDESPQDHKLFLERVIAECIDAEFRAYLALPELRTDGLSYHELTLSVIGFAWRLILYTRFHSGRQGLLF